MFKFEEDFSLGFEWSVTTAIILFIYDKEGNRAAFLYDENRKKYPLSNCVILTDNNSESKKTIKFPKPFEINEDGSLISRGDRLLVCFSKGNYSPVILGSLNFLANQKNVDATFRIEDYDLEKEVEYKEFGSGTKIHELVNEDGSNKYVYNGGYKIKVIDGNLVFSATDYTVIEGIEEINVLGKDVEIGGNTQRLDGPQYNIQNKAESANIYAKKICLGHSNSRGEEFEIDKDSKYLNPKLQQAVLGNSLKVLLEMLIDNLISAKYMGNGVVCQMSADDKIKITNQVRTKLPIVLSEVVTLLSKPGKVKKED